MEELAALKMPLRFIDDMKINGLPGRGLVVRLAPAGLYTLRVTKCDAPQHL